MSKPLFPLITESDISKPCKSLFPASKISRTSCGTDTQPPKVYDWLENKSFDPTAVTEKLQQLQHSGPQHDEREENEKFEERESEKEEHEQHKDDNSGSERKRKKKSKSKHKHKKHKHKHRERSPSPSQSVSIQDKLAQSYGKKVFIEEIPGLEFRDAYRIDRKANVENWRYESIYKEHIAKYHQHLGFCIGLHSHQMHLIKEFKKNKKQEKMDKVRYFGKENRRLVRIAPLEYIKFSCVKKGDNKPPEIILLSETGDVKQNVSNSLVDSVEYPITSDIRDALMDSKTKAYIQGETIGNDLSEVEVDYGIQNKVAEYNKSLREQPHNAELWLEFVKYQDILFGEGIFIGKKDKMPRQALIDRKISILQKALDSNPTSIKLRLSYLHLCEEIWDSDQLNKEIEKLLFTYPTDITIWRYYLTFNQSRLSVFSVSRVTKLYYKCFSKLLGYRDGGVQSCKVSDHIHRDMLDIFIQYCSFLKQSGHTERAIATYQGMIEYNLFCPSKLYELSHTDKIAVFESFWDSGVPRVGEKGAKGWSYWVDNKDVSGEETPFRSDSSEEKELEVISKQQEKWKTWLQIEKLRESSHLLPWRPDVANNETEEDCEDMERLVLFDDVSSTIFSVPGDLFLDLVLQFLMLLDVDISGHFVLGSSNLIHEQLSLYSLHQIMLDNKDIGVQGQTFNKDILDVFLSNLLQQLTKYFHDVKQTILTMIWLKLQISFQDQDRNVDKSKVKEIKKISRNLLKLEHNRNNLIVWSTYAKILWHLLQHKEACEILQTALSMFTCEDGNFLQMAGFMALHRIYVEIILNFKSQESPSLLDRSDPADKSQNQRASWVMACLAEGRKLDMDKSKVLSSTEIVKLRHKLKSKMDSCISEMEDNISRKEYRTYCCELSKCTALFEFCFNGLQPSLAAIDNIISDIESCTHRHGSIGDGDMGEVKVELCKYKIRLIVHHMNTMNAPLSLLRNVIENCLQCFPDSEYFLKVFVDIEEKSNIAGRLHRYFGHCLQDLKSPVQVVVYVYSQLKRQCMLEHKMKGNIDFVSDGSSKVVMETGLIHRIRSYLEKALEISSVNHCPLVWRLYLHAEVKFGYTERAKGVLYRAIQQCPWSKILYLDGVYLFGESKLEEMVDLMTEKEIRVQIPVEEVDILTGTDS